MKRRNFIKNTALSTLGASLIANPIFALAESPNITHLESDDLSPSVLKDEFDVHFIAVGDWGRNGEYDQNEVAKQMGDWAKNNPNNFVISVGDNFYPRGVVSETDPLWHYSFENVYTSHSLQCDWYPVLGNHDYGSDPEAQVRYSKVSRRWNMPALYYAKEFALGNPRNKVLMLMIDTDPMLHENKQQQVAEQMIWLNETLKNASADVKWRIIVGHHPYYTVGPRIKNYDTLTVREKLAPVFEAHKIDIYLSGHDHSLQHLKPDGFTHQFISGAGSELTGVSTGVPYSRFQASDHGFLYFAVNNKKINVKAVNASGKVLYQTELVK
ncbi:MULTISPECIES: metallophosphoesterase [unclassified Mucilaginibacter]|uniref:metallophosphoesterase n=1 Tax=unclassified Mucilaginibacter TaxID=2617802 RepID=UPI002AC9AFC4|nr:MULTISPECIES: metallophosphoesterase [unclassified Mucilaginibacter]MEB0261583.1 metallophosphoesterase [Mucilaginibacter sp. 10I4]MEB0277164.1 metallophosphoesterase [Mucilaginibacter sp. 10B2]MEB0300811.1 metallophosphoesterase [Mucilaginibacter sp. 5C4]WPX25263.1 metallophosphoesterase [Mucilaginibacter sp. 5C4]